jgi:hypothetical protein
MTMEVIRLGRPVAVLALLTGLGAAIASAAEPTPQEILQGRGLVQDGKLFLLPKSESEVMEQLNKVLPLADELDVLFNLWAENEQKKYTVVAMEQEMTACQAQIRAISGMYSQINSRDYFANAKRQEIDQTVAGLQQYFSQVRGQRDLIQSQIAGPIIQQQHLNKVAKAREAFLKAYDEMVPSVNKLTAAYGEASRDEKVANALKVLRQSKSVQFKLGPSDGIMQAMKRVNNAKSVLDPKYFKPKSYTSKMKSRR